MTHNLDNLRVIDVSITLWQYTDTVNTVTVSSEKLFENINFQQKKIE